MKTVSDLHLDCVNCIELRNLNEENPVVLIILYYLRLIDTYVGSPCRNKKAPFFVNVNYTLRYTLLCTATHYATQRTHPEMNFCVY